MVCAFPAGGNVLNKICDNEGFLLQQVIRNEAIIKVSRY